MVNIKDVAKNANLSVATVSRYLNKNGYVSKKSSERIEQAIRELDYKPSSIARSLSKKQSNIIGLIVPDIKNPYFPELARAVEDMAWSYGYTVVLCNSDEQTEKELLYIERLSQTYVAGLIVTTSLMDPSVYMSINTPIVALDRIIDVAIPTVATDNRKGAKLGTKYLLTNGAENLLCIRGPQGLKTADDRLTGFLEATDEQGLDPIVVTTSFDFKDAAKVIEQTLMLHPQVDGIFASSDTLAIAALHIAHKLEKRVPEELQIVGFDGIALGEMVSPALTTVGQDLYKMGAAAATMLIEQIEGKEIKQTVLNLDAQLIVRGTTRKEAAK
ncbi:LacI family DNA-binding transcriptional regulator [Solibacillus merdavium]|uniref:LacI family DNA-binding transcriptional regulator n=1 Tax=Solibacillus merdavium TaxID=2762218 RepID=A0ABR8XNY3_9BACL|nr:LacI family DNA-binding transcriptional regulator [Solibacillus merdavium]MBD8033640.1 LacI family DNA-binding transcriptional regulator [Solibacillus merdavium]